MLFEWVHIRSVWKRMRNYYLIDIFGVILHWNASSWKKLRKDVVLGAVAISSGLIHDRVVCGRCALIRSWSERSSRNM